MITDLDQQADRMIRAASDYALDALFDLSLTNYMRECDARAATRRFELHFLFPDLPPAARDELALILVDGELLENTRVILRHRFCEDQRADNEVLLEDLQTEYPQLLSAWLDKHGPGLTPLQLEILRRKLGLPLPA